MRYQGKLDTSAGGNGWAFSDFRDALERVAFPLGMWKALSFFFSLSLAYYIMEVVYNLCSRTKILDLI